MIFKRIEAICSWIALPGFVIFVICAIAGWTQLTQIAVWFWAAPALIVFAMRPR